MKHWTFLAIILFAGAAMAVVPGGWNHKTEADFSPGEKKSTTVSSRSEVLLTRQTEILLASDAAPAVVSAVAVFEKNIYLASGSNSVVYKISGGKTGKAEKFAELPGTMVTCLYDDGLDLVAGTAGDNAGLYLIDKKGKVTRLWADKAVKYIWAVEPGPKGCYFVATGPEGKVFAVQPDGKASLLYQADTKLAKNILCLAVANNKLYAGTDTSGLVIEISPDGKKGRVVLDAPEREISTLLADKQEDGKDGLYVATADAAKANSDGKTAPSKNSAGKSAKPPAKPKTKATRVMLIKDPKGKVIRIVMPSRPSGKTPTAPAPAKPVSGRGNAVYYIRPDGLVQTIFRRPVTILAMIRRGDNLILGTGNGGDIYSVTTDGDEIVRMAETDAKQVTALVATAGGRLLFATANKGSVGQLAAGFVKEGAFMSKPLDAKQIAHWGTLKIAAELPEGTGVTVETRSGNVATADDKTWSSFSKAQPVNDGYLPIGSPTARFLQYRLKLTSAGKATPAVKQVVILYQVGNLPPVVAAVVAKPSPQGAKRDRNTGGQLAYRHVAVKTADPNRDKLVFDIAYRRAGGQSWTTVAEKLAVPKYVWDTRTVSDGRYELRVTASDSPSNPPGSAMTAARVSDIVVVDNTPPVMKELAAAPGDKTIVVTGQAVDGTSRIVAISYAVDSQKDWVAVLPVDGICDSDSEKFRFEAKDLKAGTHSIAVRVRDLYGNVRHSAVSLTVK